MSVADDSEARLVDRFIDATAGLTMEEAAARLDVTLDTINRWRGGQRAPLRTKTREPLLEFVRFLSDPADEWGSAAAAATVGEIMDRWSADGYGWRERFAGRSLLRCVLLGARALHRQRHPETVMPGEQERRVLLECEAEVRARVKPDHVRGMVSS